jgi:hypothetical protein
MGENHMQAKLSNLQQEFGWFPSSQLGNPVQEAPASCHSAKLELGASDNVGRWIPAKTETS